ncbi:hypothetical protein BKA80DRAFT_267934 [Phyllosticta citrichinensis]
MFFSLVFFNSIQTLSCQHHVRFELTPMLLPVLRADQDSPGSKSSSGDLKFVLEMEGNEQILDDAETESRHK